MTRPVLLAAALPCAFVVMTRAQTPTTAVQPSAVTRTTYSKSTELFAEWRPMIIGQATRLTAHLTLIGDRFKPYAEGKVALTLTIEGSTTTAAAEGPERPGVFRLNVTPTKAGMGRIVVDVTAPTGAQHFVMENIPVYTDLQAALATQSPTEMGLISYAKERSWEEDFATAPVVVHFPGAAQVITVPSTAIVRDGAVAHVYVQRTPERFEFREVTTRRTIGTAVEITSGLRDGERVVIRGAEKMPRP
jgi:hypothetical protein